jgi:hypothetical protein
MMNLRINLATMNHHKYDQRLEIRLTSSEKKLARQLAKETGLSLSCYLRRCILQKQLPRKITAISVSTYQELGEIAVTLNQLAIAFNHATENGFSPPSLNPCVLTRLETLLHQIRLEIASGKVKRRKTDDSETS